MARSPIVRWALVAVILFVGLAFYFDDTKDPPRGTYTPKWGPKTPAVAWQADDKPKKETAKQQFPPDAQDDRRPLPDFKDPIAEGDSVPAILTDPIAPVEDSGATVFDDHAGSLFDDPIAPATGGMAPPMFGAMDLKNYQTADDFLEHFKSVREIVPMSVSQSKTTCKWDSQQDVNFQFGAESDWVTNERSDEEIAQKQKDWHEFIANDLMPYNKVADKFSGQGIVVCAGNGASLKRLQVLLKMLRYHGSTLPVEVHYYGDEELDAAARSELHSTFPNIRFSDLNGPDVLYTTKHGWVTNYNVKLAALLNSRFAEIMLLDSDNVPVSDPKSLFESNTYKTFGTVFYPDIARTRPENPMWAITNTHCRADEYEQESGQMVVDKRRFWYHLQLATFFGHHDYYQEFLLGDKDCFRFAWHALETPYGRPARWITSVGYVARPPGQPSFPETNNVGGSGIESDRDKAQGGPQSIYCGHSFGQHHPDGFDAPILFLHGGLLKTLHIHQVAFVRDHGGLFSAYKQSSKAASINDVTEKVGLKWDGGVTYLGVDKQKDVSRAAFCTDMEEVEPKPVGDMWTKELAGLEEAFKGAGGYWMLEDGNNPDW